LSMQGKLDARPAGRDDSARSRSDADGVADRPSARSPMLTSSDWIVSSIWRIA
jgi:hypothetical protein